MNAAFNRPANTKPTNPRHPCLFAVRYQTRGRTVLVVILGR
jgi:hypothetical protein